MFLRIIIAIILVSAWGTAYAQQQPIPSPAEAGALNRKYNRPKEFVPQKEIKLPKAAPKMVAPPNAKKVTFLLSKIIVEGNTVYTDEEIKALYADLIGKEVSLSATFDIASKITDLYQKDGYLLSFAVVPVQEIENTARITVIEGFIDDVSFEGKVHKRSDLFDSWVKQIKAERPTNKATLERVILLAEKLPGVTIDTLVSASKTTPGASNLRLLISHDYFEGHVVVNNHGSRYVGPFQEETMISTNSALGMYEKIQVRNIDTLKNRESQYRELSISTMLNSAGTTSTFLVSQNKVYPGFTLNSAEINSVTRRMVLNVSHPLILTQKESLSINATIETFNSKLRTLDVQTSKDSLRVLRLGADYSNVDSSGSYGFISGLVSQGFELFGARKSGSENLSRASGQSDFTKATFDAGYNYMLKHNIGALFTAKGQWAGSQLLSSEEFFFGGRQFGRGYDSSELVGDHGVAGAVELTYYRPGSDLGKWVNSYQLYGFFDYGAVWKIDSDQEDDRKMASSAGIGTKINLKNQTMFNFEVNRPLTRQAASRGTKDEEDTQFLAYLKVQF